MQSLFTRLSNLILPFNWYSVFTPLGMPQGLHWVALPDLPDEIWFEIFQFATYIHSSATIAPLDPFVPKPLTRNVLGPNSPSLSFRTKRALVLTCRPWKRIATQLLYGHIHLVSPRQADQVLFALHSGLNPTTADSWDSEYGRCTKHIQIFSYARGCAHHNYLRAILRVLQYCPNIRVLSACWQFPLPREFLDHVAKMTSASLQELTFRDNMSDSKFSIGAEYLSKFQNLRLLDLTSFFGEPGSSDVHSLPSVTTLIVFASHSSLSSAAAINFPSLESMIVKTSDSAASFNRNDMLTFLPGNGRNIRSIHVISPTSAEKPGFVHLDASNKPCHFHGRIGASLFLEPGLCPQLETLTFPATTPAFDLHGHKSLRRIGISNVKADLLYPNKPHVLVDHLQSLTPELYPSLETVRTVDFLLDMEYETTKDIFIWWVEKFERQGIDFQDGEGVVWTYDGTSEDGSSPVGVEADENAI